MTGSSASGPDGRTTVLWLARGLGPGGMERLLVPHARLGDPERFRYVAAYLTERPKSLQVELEAAGLVHGLPEPFGDALAASSYDGVRHGLGLAEDAIMVLCVANHRAEKDYDNLMDAMALLVAREKDDGEGSAPLTVVAAGAGPLLDDARRRATALGLDGRLQMLGHRDDVGSLMAAADAFVLASRFEGLPVALMEATAAGLPVVATRVGGIPEALAGEAGELLVPPQNPEALAALARLGDPQLRRRLSEASRVAAMQFDASQAVTAQELMYAELVS